MADLFDDESLAEPDAQQTAWYDADRDLAIVEYFHPNRAEVEARLSAMQAFLSRHAPGETWNATLRVLPAEDWAETWKRFFHAEKVSDRIWVKPSWESCPAAAGDVVIEIDPGMSFGTGQHGTTRGCLQMLDGLISAPASVWRRTARPAPGRENVSGQPLRHSPAQAAAEPSAATSAPPTLADIGCGSGILAIAAAKLGYREILAMDNDPVAVRVAIENAALNGVGDRITLQTGALGEEPLSGPYDVVVANILAGVLIAHADTLTELLAPAPSSRLILSGILTSQADEVAAAFAARGFTPLARLDIAEWTTFCMGRT